MSTISVIVTICAVPAAALVLLTIGFVTYRAVANDIARRLRDDAARLSSGPLDPRTPSIRYAADRIEHWGRR
jgi:hypothetical protein